MSRCSVIIGFSFAMSCAWLSAVRAETPAPQPDPRDPTRLIIKGTPNVEPILLGPDLLKATQAYLLRDGWRRDIPLAFDQGPDGVILYPSEIVRHQKTPRYAFEITDQPTQHVDGRIVLPVKHAAKTGLDTYRWSFAFTRWGRYDVELTYAIPDAAGKTTAALMIDGAASAEHEIESTGTATRYQVITLGTVSIIEAGQHDLILRLGGGARLLALTLRPTTEGESPSKANIEGAVVLKAKDATVLGTLLRYESAPEKNTLGFWTQDTDRAYWDFKAAEAGPHEVWVLQGCGAGEGGSVVDIAVGREKLSFEVESTGGFQQFKDRKVGTIQIKKAKKTFTLVVSSSKKVGKAVMDLRQIRLVPVKP